MSALLPFWVSVALIVPGVQTGEANTIDAISWAHDGSGHTAVTIVCGETIDPSSFRSYPVSHPPRAVIVLEGIAEPIKPESLTVGDRHLDRVRLGHHPDSDPPEMHVIFDLTTERMEILEIRHDGARLTAVVGEVEPPTSTPFVQPSPSPHPPSPTRTLQPSPTPTPTPTPTSTISYPDRPAPPVAPVKQQRSSATPTNTESMASAEIFATPTPPPELITATRVVDVATSARGDGSTLLKITANGTLPQGCARTLDVAEEPPRIVVTIRGVSAPDLARSWPISDANITKIRLIHDAEIGKGELHLLLHLSRPGVKVLEMNQVGRHLVVNLSPPKSPDIEP